MIKDKKILVRGRKW